MTQCLLVLPFLWLWTLYAALVDLRTRRIPTGGLRSAIFALTLLCTVPIQVVHFTPSALAPLILLFGVLLSGWHIGAIGGGDVKLWAIWWLWTPPGLIWTGAMVSMGLWVFGGLFRRWVLRVPRGQKSPAAWVVVLYGAWLIAVTLLPEGVPLI